MHSIKPLLSDLKAKRNVILYLNRGENHDHRGVINNNEILEYLKGFAKYNGFELVIKSNDNRGTFDEERDIYSRAIICIGPHGGMFGNMIFMQYGSYVIEFNGWLRKNDYRPDYHGLAQANGLHYFYVAPEEFEYFHHRMTVNVKHLAIILKHICTEIDCAGVDIVDMPQNEKPGLIQGIAAKLGVS